MRAEPPYLYRPQGAQCPPAEARRNGRYVVSKITRILLVSGGTGRAAVGCRGRVWDLT